MDYTEAAEKLKAGEIDAFFCTAGTRTEVIGQLSKECDIHLISLDDKCIDKMLSAYSLCEKCINFSSFKFFSSFCIIHIDLINKLVSNSTHL